MSASKRNKAIQAGRQMAGMGVKICPISRRRRSAESAVLRFWAAHGEKLLRPGGPGSERLTPMFGRAVHVRAATGCDRNRKKEGEITYALRETG